MREYILDSALPYTVTFAEAVTVTHTRQFVFICDQGRECYGFIHVMEGILTFRFPDGTHLDVEKGRVVYIPKGAKYHCTYQPELTRVVIFQFDLQVANEEQPGREILLLPQEAQRLFRESRDQYAVLDCFRCAARIYELLGILRQKQAALPKKFRRLLPAVERIEGDPSQTAEVAYYAQLCGMSVPGFRRSFKEYTGQSPVEYRNNLRLAYARKLIASGGYSVEEAAQRSGFTNLSFFYRLFRRRFGILPGSL